MLPSDLLQLKLLINCLSYGVFNFRHKMFVLAPKLVIPLQTIIVNYNREYIGHLLMILTHWLRRLLLCKLLSKLLFITRFVISNTLFNFLSTLLANIFIFNLVKNTIYSVNYHFLTNPPL